MVDLSLTLAAAAGLALGGFYFGSLWWVIRRVADSPWPEAWLLASFLVRSAIILAGFFLVMDGRWERVLACLLGFLLARTLLVQVIRPDDKQSVLTRG